MHTPEYNPILRNPYDTVVAECPPTPSRANEYQSEDDLERSFIEQLVSQGYEYINITDEKSLITNLRTQLNKLNAKELLARTGRAVLSDAEWQSIYTSILSNPQHTILDKTRLIQQDSTQTILLDDGSSFNFKLLDKANLHNNYLQVINQYETDTGKRKTRYDVTILVNGLPLIHVELKRRGVPIREAFNQIQRYQRDSFWASSGLFNFVQIFVISNGTNTKYYSNTVRPGASDTRLYTNPFEFTNYWADTKNNPITDLTDFTATFLTKRTLLSILTRYCVLTVDNRLLVMRPYQIVATEKILNKLLIAYNTKLYGTIDAGGYVWHTTGSGKTLTSFKTAQLAADLPFVKKVLFVVDRKDLDYQTIQEYDKFEKGAANSNNSTRVLKKQLEDPTARIIVTTIQKLSRFISQNPEHAVYNEHIVLVFDECHRSQFGTMHDQIVTSFKKYYLFGFTGTPIIAVNSGQAATPKESSKADTDILHSRHYLRTTAQRFGDRLHEYTIINAINDENVLPFRVDYVNTLKVNNTLKDTKVKDIDAQGALESPERIAGVVEYILDNYANQTLRTTSGGFNSILATSSINAAKTYYTEFQRRLAEHNPHNLKVAIIYSYAPNEDDPTGLLSDESLDDTLNLDAPSRDFLDQAIKQYNTMFKTNFSTQTGSFENYYKDISDRVKKGQIDLLIVVNMFLTGFDAPTLNTLWVDKNLRHHGLMQAFSRTNRLYDRAKVYGNIVCFRNLKEAVDAAISMYGDADLQGIVILKDFKYYYYGDKQSGFIGYKAYVEKLKREYPLGKSLDTNEKKRDFLFTFGRILYLRNLLRTFREFRDKDLLTVAELQDYKSIHNDTYDGVRKLSKAEQESILQDVVVEVELVQRDEVNVDYVLMQIQKYHDKNSEDKELLADITRSIDSSPSLRSKKDLILEFIEKVNYKPDEQSKKWNEFIRESLKKDVEQLIKDTNVSAELTLDYVKYALKHNNFSNTGRRYDAILPPVRRFGGGRRAISEKVDEKLQVLFEKYRGLI